jgi:predicted nucleic acid-binding protein
VISVPFKVVLDANVLYPFSLRDTLLRSAEASLVQVYWSEEILDEVRRNLVGNTVVTIEQAERLCSKMREAFPEAMVVGHEPLIVAMKNDEKDRHVVAAAVKAGADVIVTSNTKHFRDIPEDIEPQSPDEFLCNLFDLEPSLMVELLQRQAGDLRKPARTLEEMLGGLAKMVPDFVAEVRAYMAR